MKDETPILISYMLSCVKAANITDPKVVGRLVALEAMMGDELGVTSIDLRWLEEIYADYC